MRTVYRFTLALILLIITIPALGASKPHVILLGKPQTVKIFLARDESQATTISVRPLYVDSRLKDYTVGDSHDITDRLFVVQRAYRLNDSLPGEAPKDNKWVWQRGDWLLVDRLTGHISQLKLPDFDTASSHVTWYRDYAAYCGTSDSGEKWSALVSQIGVRKALFRKELSKGANASPAVQVDCPAIKWERHPARVTFVPVSGQPFTVNVVPHHADLMPADSSEDE